MRAGRWTTVESGSELHTPEVFTEEFPLFSGRVPVFLKIGSRV